MLVSFRYDILEIILYVAFSNLPCVLCHMVIILTAYYIDVVRRQTKQRTLFLIFFFFCLPPKGQVSA